MAATTLAVLRSTSEAVDGPRNPLPSVNDSVADSSATDAVMSAKARTDDAEKVMVDTRLKDTVGTRREDNRKSYLREAEASETEDVIEKMSMTATVTRRNPPKVVVSDARAITT
ncbi:hypothetical protein PBRA_004391 [Plasmodiophora brassicae]|uniref:Uncharacterized protein n=1 Tax=Plasmodiophora brassicae TaxID=37360 RepID=A0A0G4IKG8_PLABS|nr:hypothetical protein PBRA_004391 [Plasmodiophora brassicae]